jgi:hypothetical protein
MSNEIRGWQPNIKINSTLLEVKSGEPRNIRSTAPGDTTSTGRARYPVVDKESFEFNFTAIRYSTLNPHASPYFIAGTGVDLVNLAYWPNADDISDATKSWRSATFLIEEYSESFNADQGLLTISVKGQSQGAFKRPGDA